MENGDALISIETVKAVLNAGAFGLVVWLFVNTFKFTLPKMQDKIEAANKDMLDRLEKMHHECEEMLSHQRANYRQEMQLTRESNERREMELMKQVSAVAESVDGLADKVHAMRERKTAGGQV